MSSGVKGRILRLKQGYNPNSSSIGTIVFAMPAALLASTVAFGAAAAFIATAFSSAGEGAPEAPPTAEEASASASDDEPRD